MHHSRSHYAVIRVYNGAGNVIETHEHRGVQKGTVAPGAGAHLNGAQKTGQPISFSGLNVL